MDDREPTRWSTGSEDDVAMLISGLAEARREGPSPEQLARMRAALSLPAPGADAASAAPTGVRSTWLTKISGIGAVLLAVGALVMSRTAELGGDQRSVVRDHVAAPGLEPPAPSTVVEPSAAPSATEMPAAPPAAPERRAARASKPKPAAVEQSPNVNAELSLLRSARAHVRSAPPRALALVAEHERLYARGLLIEEREVIAIEALLAGERLAAARARAERFFTQHPRSAHARRVRALLREAGVLEQE